MNLAREQRLRFIDFCLQHYGYINRSAIEDYFGVSTAQASYDLGEYMSAVPRNIEYDAKAKRYIKRDQFERWLP